MSPLVAAACRREELTVEPSICFVATSRAMLNLLVPDGPAAIGGAELQLSLLARALMNKGWAVSFLLGDYGQDTVTRTSDGIQLLRAYQQSGGCIARILCRDLPQFWRSLARVDADIYVSRGLTGQAGIIAAFAKLHRRRYVFWFGKNSDAKYGVPALSPLPLLERLPAWYGIRFADAVIVQSNDQDTLLRKYVGRNGVVIPNVSPWPDAPSADSAGEYVLWVGSIQPKKRPHLMLDVASQLPNVQFVMAGGEMPKYADLYDSVERRAKQAKNVDFLGFVPFEQTKELFQHAGVLVSTSDAEEEGFPNVFLQAWSCGVPTIATCDPDGVIKANGLGFHCSEISEVEDSIATVLGDAQLRSQLARQARKYVADYHSPEAVSSKLNRVLRELLRSGK